jgi:hypothetical protein
LRKARISLDLGSHSPASAPPRPERFGRSGRGEEEFDLCRISLIAVPRGGDASELFFTLRLIQLRFGISLLTLLTMGER